MKALMKTITGLLASLGLAQGAFALNSDQVRGEIVSVDTESNRIEVRVIESGAQTTAQEGTVESYVIPPNTPIEYEIDRVVYMPYRTGDFGLDDLAVGDRVLLDFEAVNNDRTARKVRNEETRDVAVRERVRREGVASTAGTRERADDRVGNSDPVYLADAGERSRLPDSASILPSLAITGVMLAGAAGLLRARRKSQSA